MPQYVGTAALARVFPGVAKYVSRDAIGKALGFASANPAVEKALGSTVMRMLQGIAGEVATEDAQEIVAIGAERVGREYATEYVGIPAWDEIFERLGDTTVQTAESVFPLVAIGGGLSAAMRRKAPVQEFRELEQELLDQYAGTAQQSEVMRELPETGQELLAAFAAEGAASGHIYVSPQAIQEAFFQEENSQLMQEAQDMGITPESLSENIALGADVAIPFQKAAAHIFSSQERYASLRDAMRISPESPTAADIEEASQVEQDQGARQAYLDEVLQPLFQRQEESVQIEQARQELARPYVEQLMQAGWNKKQAQQYGQLLAANAEQMAPVFGMSPQEYLQQSFAGYRSMTQADFEAGNVGLFQEEDRDYIREDFGLKPDDATAKVVSLPEGTVPEMQVKNLGKWIIDLLERQGGNIEIASTKQTVEFTHKNINASTKRSSGKRKGAREHNEAYLALRDMIANAQYWKSRKEDGRHSRKGDQDIYTSALAMDGKLYSVILKMDVVPEFVINRSKESGIEVADNRYKDHKLSEIEIAPALSHTMPGNGVHMQGITDAISEVSLGVLRGSVKPSRIQNNTLYQNETTARGAMAALPDGRHFVALFESQNASTVLHETAHYFLEQLRNANALAAAPAWVHEAWQKLEKTYGFSEWDIDRQGWVNVQERFAREFEAYCREGKAPSPELQTAFARFRKWLTGIYKSVRAILGDRQASEDVREVFDRLLATEAEIAESARAMTARSGLDHLGDVSAELRQRYLNAVDRAIRSVDAGIANRNLVEKRQAERELREQAANEIDASQTFVELNNIAEKGLPLDALKNLIDENLLKYVRNRWRGKKGMSLIRKGGIMDLDEAAARLGFDNVQALATGLATMPTRKEAIDNLTATKLAEWDSAHAAEMEYSSAYDEAIAIEVEALTGKRQVSPAALMAQIERRCGVKPLAQLDAEYKALKARLRSDERLAARAYNEGKRNANSQWREKYAELRQQERLRRAALHAAWKAKTEAAKIVAGLRKIAASKALPYDYSRQIRAIMAHWQGLGTSGMALTRQELQDMPSIDEFLAARASPFGEPITAPQWLIDSLKTNRGRGMQRFSDLSIEQMRDIRSLVAELAHAGRSHDRMLTAQAAQAQADANAAEIASVKEQTEAAVNGLGESMASLATGLQATGEVAAQAKATAEAALPKAGGEVTGDISMMGHAAAHRVIQFREQRDADNEQSISNVGFLRNIYTVNEVRQSIDARAYKADGSAVNSVVAAVSQPDGTAYATCPPPRQNNYGSDIVNTKAMKDHTLMKVAANTTIHAGGAGASDTVDLGAGRGLSADKPFASLDAALAWICSSLAGMNVVTLMLHEDMQYSGTIRAANIGMLNIRGDTSERTLTLTGGGIIVDSGNVMPSDMKLAGASGCGALLQVTSGLGQIYLGGPLELLGSVTSAVIGASGGGTVLFHRNMSLTGSVTGKRYSVTNGGRILTGGKGESAIPGTEAGTCDASSVYA